MRLLITGATGFAGRHLVAHCAALGDEIHAVVVPGRERVPAPPARVHGAALDDDAALEEIVTAVAPDAVVHLAASSSVGGSFADPLETWRVNLGGTLALLEALRRSGSPARALIVTSGEIHGRIPLERLPVGPDTPLHPLSPYGAAKAAADLAALQYREAYGVRAIRVRAFNHVGPGQDARFVLPSVARQIARAEAAGERSVEVRVGNIETRRDFTDVRDMVRAYRLLAEAGDPDAVYVACSGRSMAVRELIEGIAPLARIPVTIVSDPDRVRAGEQPDLYGDPARLRADTGWVPAIPIAATLADTLDHWRERVASDTDDEQE